MDPRQYEFDEQETLEIDALAAFLLATATGDAANDPQKALVAAAIAHATVASVKTATDRGIRVERTETGLRVTYEGAGDRMD